MSQHGPGVPDGRQAECEATGDTFDTGRIPSNRALLVGLLLAPLAWIVQANLAQTIAAHACYSADRPNTVSQLTGMTTWLAVVIGLSLVLGLFGLLTGLRNWRHTAALAEIVRRGQVPGRHAGSVCFLARAGAISSGLFTLGIVGSAMAVWIVSPCGPGLTS